MKTIFSRKHQAGVAGVDDLPDALLGDLSLLFSAAGPAGEFDAVMAASAVLPERRSASRARSMTMAAGMVAIAAVAALALAPQFRGGSSETASAAELIEKSHQALTRLAAGETSYIITRHGVIDGGSKPGDIQVSRMWSRDNEHWRMEIDIIDLSTGQPAPGTGYWNVRNGDDFWIAFQDGDILRVINRSVAAMGFERVGFSPKATLEETLSAFKICEDGSKVSTGELVAGRPTFRIDCTTSALSIWLDRETFIPLKSESSGRVNSEYTTTAVEFGPIPDERFDYKPPSGTWVHYQDRGESAQVP